jgi:hypothetical protein
MSYLQDHLKTGSYCREKYSQPEKPTVRIKGASSYYRDRKLSELASVIKGISYSMYRPAAKLRLLQVLKLKNLRSLRN